MKYIIKYYNDAINFKTIVFTITSLLDGAEVSYIIMRLVVRVWQWAPMIHQGERRWRFANGDRYLNPMQHPGSLSRVWITNKCQYL